MKPFFLQQLKNRFTAAGISYSVAHLLVFSVLYYAAVVIGLASRIDFIALFWPANGVAFGFFILRPKKEWPAYLFSMSLGYIGGMYATGDYSWSIILGALQANIIQTVTGAWLVQRYVPRPVKFTSVREILITLFCTAFIGSFASALFSVVVLGAGFMETPWQLWASGMIDNAGSTMLTLPFILVFISTFSLSELKSATWRRWAEGTTLALITILLTEYVFTIGNSADVLMRTLPYLLIPCILWGGLRFGQQGVTAAALFIGVESVRHTLLGEGPFAGNDSGFILVLTVHLYIGIITITGLIVAALMKQQATVMQSLAGGIAHEMRNPLAQFQYALHNITEYIQNADTDRMPAETAVFIKRQVTEARHSIARSRQIIDFILDGIHEREINATNFDYISASKVLNRAVKEYSYESSTDKDKVSVRIEEDFLFKGDETLFLYVLFNLLNNALYYLKTCPDSVIELCAKRVSDKNAIIVRDSGPGIPKSLMPHLFDSFFTAGKKGGTGLGLAYCQRIMHAFKGQIRCKSVEGEFTEFVLSFPSVSESEQQAHLQQKIKRLEDLSILLVDDDLQYCKALLARLPENDLNITMYDDVRIAVLEMKARPCDLLVMDLNMPGSGGYNAISWIRKGDVFADGECTNHKTLPLMAFSSEPDPPACEKALAAGATSFLSKGCDATGFVEGLLRCLDLSEKQASDDHSTDDLYGLTILVVDDQQFNLAHYRKILEPFGIKVIEAEGGETALDILANTQCDALVCDLHMPGMDGLQLAATIRSKEAASQQRGTSNPIPIIAVSGYPGKAMKLQCAQSGINSLLPKPVDTQQLVDRLVKLLASGKTVTQQQAGNYLETEAANRNAPNDAALARLLHDIRNLILNLEYLADSLQEHLPELVESYPGSEDKPLTRDSITALQDAPDEIKLITRACWQKTDTLAHGLNQAPTQDIKPTRPVLDDINLLWTHLESIHRHCLSSTLRVLLSEVEAIGRRKASINAHHKESHGQTLVKNASWERLNRIEPEYAEAILQGIKILHDYDSCEVTPGERSC